MPTIDPFFDHHAHLKTFPDHILRDLARNEAAPRDYRKHATEILMVRKSALAKHEDLREFYVELEAELDGLVFEHPAPADLGLGPLTSGATTKTMFGSEIINNFGSDFTGFDFEIPSSADPVPPESKEKKPRKSKDKPDAVSP